ncbi:hypothetical protein F5Y04DRAFT_152430 [Hypomontagnella monticulosa]|nr:hypothetical protein F5Y04DRAFT_152430 [Hypomontagnella monticulosa]
MSEASRPNSGRSNTVGAEAERARLRRNQRNSRARKQAYIQSLEQRWSECVRLGVQATAEMQKEARRVQEENRLLRTVLRNQGLDDIAIQKALDDVKLAEANIGQTKDASRQEGLEPNQPVDHNLLPPQWPPTMPQLGGPQLLGSQEDIDQSLGLHDWLADLCNIKDAFGAEVNFNDQAPQSSLDYIGQLPDDSMPFAIDESLTGIPPFPMQMAYPMEGLNTSENGHLGQRDP